MHEWKMPSTNDSSNEEKRTVFAGKDALRGGTWLGVSFIRGKSDSYRFGVVHNVRHSDPVDATKQSRGDLVSDFLTGSEDAKTYAEIIGNKGQDYLGFTLVLVDAEGCYFVSNRAPSSIVNDSNQHTHAVTVRKLKPGIYGLTNSLLDTPWPKLVAGKAKFVAALTSSSSSSLWRRLKGTQPSSASSNNKKTGEMWKKYEAELMRSLTREVLCDATRFPENLPRILSPDREICLSSIFIEPYVWDRSGFYGTRMQTLVFVRGDGTLVCRERSLDTDSPIKNWIGRWNVTTREFMLCGGGSGSSSTGNVDGGEQRSNRTTSSSALLTAAVESGSTNNEEEAEEWVEVVGEVRARL